MALAACFACFPSEEGRSRTEHPQAGQVYRPNKGGRYYWMQHVHVPPSHSTLYCEFMWPQSSITVVLQERKFRVLAWVCAGSRGCAHMPAGEHLVAENLELPDKARSKLLQTPEYAENIPEEHRSNVLTVGYSV